MNRPDKEEGKKKKKGDGDGQTNREEEEKKVQPKKKKREGDGQTNREEEEKKERRRSRRRRSSCFTAPPLLRHRLLPFLLLLCFLSLQMMFRPSIHILAETARFRRYSRYGRYFFRYGIRGLSVPVH